MLREELEKAYQSALNDAAKQLSYRELSESALRKKLLKKEHSEEAIDYAIAWLIERKMLSDNRFAQSVLGSYERRGYGEMRIRQELYKRGVGREESDIAMAEYEPNHDALITLLEKKLKGDVSDPKAVQRAVAYLQRRGFKWSDIRTALHTYGASLEEQFD